MNLLRIAARVAADNPNAKRIKPHLTPSKNFETTLEVHHEDEAGQEHTYLVDTMFSGTIIDHKSTPEFYNFRTEDGVEVDEDEFMKMFDPDMLRMESLDAVKDFYESHYDH